MLKTKYLYTVVLAALCLTLVTGVALAQDSWNVLADNFPTGVMWDQQAGVSVDTENNGSTTWQTTWALTSVDGVTPDAIAIDRWGLTEVPVPGPVTYTRAAPRLSGLCDFDFDIVGPPIASLAYNLPITPTSAPVVVPFDCNWYLANASGTLLTMDISDNEIVVGRFNDILPGTAGAWASPWIQELAGRVPVVVTGYGGGAYRPTVQVDRAQMAVYEARALELPTAAYEGLFPADVPDTHWAWPWIEAMNRAGLVGGYGGGEYRPAVIVNRDAMAVYVARGMIGGVDVPSGPLTPTFWFDVPTSHWAYDEIEYCAANNVVGGYGGGQYRPNLPVTRDQMAVFVYRGFVQPTGAAVVLAGPAVTMDADPDYDGWTSAAVTEADAPGTAYIALDALRLTEEMAPVEVTFELVGPETPAASVELSAEDIANAKTAAEASGNPYLYVTWNYPEGLTEGDYTLVVTVNGVALARQPDLTIGPIPDPPALEEVVVYMTRLQSVNEGTLVSGSYSDIQADDDNYVVVSTTAGKCSTEWHSEAMGTLGLDAEEVLTARIDVVAKCTSVDFPGSVISWGSSGSTTWCADLAFPVADTETAVIWVDANKAKFVDMFARTDLRVILAQCCGEEEYTTGTYTTSYDLVKYTFTLKP